MYVYEALSILCYNYILHLGAFARNTVLEGQSYTYCVSQRVQLNASLPAFHTVSYRGPLTTALKLNFDAIPSVSEELFVNESIDIKHTAGTFQRTFVIDANVERLSISFKLRKFVGPTDFCGYGGIRMFNHLNTSVNRHPRHNYLQAHVPARKTKRNRHSEFLRSAPYLPICTNDSLIFKRQFYLDFGKTYFVFYDFNSVWHMDVTLNVHPSKYQALYNYEETYCSYKIQAYIFDSFFINCKLSLVKLTQEIPLILQWSLGNIMIQKNILENFECVWHKRMDLIINQNYMNLVIFNSAKQICSPNSVLFITGASKTRTVVLGSNTQNQTIPNVESIKIKRFLGACPDLEQSSYAIILTSSQDVFLSFSRPADFFEVDYKTKYQILTDRYVSLDATMPIGLYIFHIMTPFYDILLHNKWIFYSLIISNDCYQSAQMTIYFKTSTFEQTRLVHFEFPQDRYHYAFQDYSLISVLQFYLQRFSLECTGYIEFTISPFTRSFTVHRWKSFQVSANTLFTFSDIYNFSYY